MTCSCQKRAPDQRRAVLDVLEGRRAACLVQADALDFLDALPPACIDAVIADGPFSSGGAFRGDRVQQPISKYSKGVTQPDFEGDTRDQLAHTAFNSIWLRKARRVSRPGAPICVFSDWRQIGVYQNALQVAGWIYRGCLPWTKKNASRPQRGRFKQDAEFVLWGSNGPMSPDREMGGGGSRSLPGSVDEAPVPRNKRQALTEKPEKVMRTLVKICKPGGVILDPFVGGASTGVAARKEGYRFLGCEITREYFERAARALATAQEDAA